jgi:hypothetical protein
VSGRDGEEEQGRDEAVVEAALDVEQVASTNRTTARTTSTKCSMAAVSSSRW